MREMLSNYGPKNTKAGPTAFTSMKLHCYNTNIWVDVMNASVSKGCTTIESIHSRHIYQLCDYVAYLTDWKRSVSDPNLFFPLSTYEDVCWTSLGAVLLAFYYLPLFPGHDINQMRLGSDPCESTFNLKRNANANASKLDTDHIMSSIHGGVITQMAASRKGNVGKKNKYHGKELAIGKISRRRK